jgi:hypothetical protein
MLPIKFDQLYIYRVVIKMQIAKEKIQNYIYTSKSLQNSIAINSLNKEILLEFIE